MRDATGAAHWVDDESFDIHHHVVREKLERAKGQSEREALQARVGELATTPLDPDRPLWQFRLIESYDGGSALIARVHHCIGDGIALISVMMTITDGGSDPPVRKRRAAAERRCRRRRRLAVRGGAEAARRPLGQGRRAGRGEHRPRPRRPGRPAEGHRQLDRRRAHGGQGARRRHRDGDDGRRLADPAQGQAERQEARRLGRADSARAGEGDRQGARLLDQRRAARLRWPAPSATGCAARATIPKARRSAPWCR